MQKINYRSKSKLSQKSSFPCLKTSLIMSKAMLTVSKVDLDSRIINKQSLNNQSRQSQHTRTYSGLPNKLKNKQMAITSRPDHKQIIQEKLKISNGLDSFYQTQPQYLKSLNIQKSRVSTKSYGYVKAYGANSHPGPLNNTNQDRICIVTNLNKTMNKLNQVSFYAIYDGHNGSNYADFMRDNFHILLIQDQNFYKDIQLAIKNTIRKIQKDFQDDSNYYKDTSSVSFIMLIIINQIGFCVQLGEPRLIISRKHGLERSRGVQKISQVKSTSLKKLTLTSQTSSTRPSIRNLATHQSLKQISIRKILLDQNIDFIILGSQGVYETLKDQDLVRKAWISLLNKSNIDNIHMLAGQALNSIMNEIMSNISTKNISIIFLVFNLVSQTLKKDQKLQLPYLPIQ